MRITSSLSAAIEHARVLVVGGGAAGLGAASQLSRVIRTSFAVTLVDASETHYYQPGFTLVAAGILPLSSDMRRQDKLIPSGVRAVRKSAAGFRPAENIVELSDGSRLSYDVLVVATGIELRFDLVKGLADAIETPLVTSIYHPKLAEKTYRLLHSVAAGEFLFTFPHTPIKCAGAPQKICYLADDILRSRGVRDVSRVHYSTTLPRIFGVPKYAEELEKIVKERDIHLHTRQQLIEVDAARQHAVFRDLDSDEVVERRYDFLHVGPPCSTVRAVRECADLTDAGGWVDVDGQTLQSRHFPNVFAVGDCANTPNAKTAAAVSSQLKAVTPNVLSFLAGRALSEKYNGYGSCPLVLSRNSAMLAEFGPNGPLETLPFNQARPSYWAYLMKRYAMPPLYWHGLIRGRWHGPATIRKMLHLGRGE